MATTDVSSQSSGDAHTETFDRDILSGTTSSVDESTMELENSTSLDSLKPGLRIDLELADLFTENAAAKIWRVATRLLEQEDPPQNFPEYIPATGETAGKYTLKPAMFWTCGFFPGSLYAILERVTKYPKSLSSPKAEGVDFHHQLLEVCRAWSEPLHAMSLRTNTHDIGFILQPALRMDWELTGNQKALDSILTGASSLATRYNETVGAIRSWDKKVTHRDDITDMDNNFLVIIDSMCSEFKLDYQDANPLTDLMRIKDLDLLYYAGHRTANHKFIDMATSHAHAVIRSILRKDSSTFHVANFDPKTGAIKQQMTHQGYADDSTWSRGQAWGILGFTQTYIWTKEPIFLETAIALATFFLTQISNATVPYPYVPLWDFDAPIPEGSDGLRDTSAGMIAANGLLLLHQILNNNSPYLDAVLRITKDTLNYCLASETARFEVDNNGKVKVPSAEEGQWDGILMHATVNNNSDALFRYSDHGLVYADYYFLELGNKLLRMGLV